MINFTNDKIFASDPNSHKVNWLILLIKGWVMENRILFIESDETLFNKLSEKFTRKTLRVVSSEDAINEYSLSNVYYGLSFINITDPSRLCYSDSPHIKKMMSRKNDFIRTIAYYDEAKLNDDQKKMIPQIKEQNFFEDVVSTTELLEKNQKCLNPNSKNEAINLSARI